MHAPAAPVLLYPHSDEARSYDRVLSSRAAACGWRPTRSAASDLLLQPVFPLGALPSPLDGSGAGQRTPQLLQRHESCSYDALRLVAALCSVVEALLDQLCAAPPGSAESKRTRSPQTWQWVVQVQMPPSS